MYRFSLLMKCTVLCTTNNMLSAYTAKVFVEQLNITVNHFQDKQLVVACFHTAAEVQTRIPST